MESFEQKVGIFERENSGNTILDKFRCVWTRLDEFGRGSDRSGQGSDRLKSLLKM